MNIERQSTALEWGLRANSPARSGAEPHP